MGASYWLQTLLAPWLEAFTLTIIHNPSHSLARRDAFYNTLQRRQSYRAHSFISFQVSRSFATSYTAKLTPNSDYEDDEVSTERGQGWVF